MHQLRCVRAGMPEPGDFDGPGVLPHRPGALHRVRGPLRRAPVRAGLPGELHSARSGACRVARDAVGEVPAPAAGGAEAGGPRADLSYLRSVAFLATFTVEAAGAGAGADAAESVAATSRALRSRSACAAFS